MRRTADRVRRCASPQTVVTSAGRRRAGACPSHCGGLKAHRRMLSRRVPEGRLRCELLAFVAAATARLAMTPIRCARYSGSAWMSPLRPSAGSVTPSSDFGREALARALPRRPCTRKTPFEPAPVTATRTSLAALGDEDADQRIARGRIAELRIGRLRRDREGHLGDDLALLQRRIEQAGEELVGGDLALVGDDGGAERQAGRRDNRPPGRCWRPSRRSCRGCARRDRRSAGQLRQGREWPRARLRSSRRRHGVVIAPIDDGAALDARCPRRPSTGRGRSGAGGAARRCFIVGSSVWPPARSLRVLGLGRADARLPQAGRAVIVEGVHGVPLRNADPGVVGAAGPASAGDPAARDLRACNWPCVAPRRPAASPASAMSS